MLGVSNRTELCPAQHKNVVVACSLSIPRNYTADLCSSKIHRTPHALVPLIASNFQEDLRYDVDVEMELVRPHKASEEIGMSSPYRTMHHKASRHITSRSIARTATDV